MRCGGCRHHARRVCRNVQYCRYVRCEKTTSGYTCYYCHCVIYGTRYAYPKNRHYYACGRCVPDSWFDSECESESSSSSHFCKKKKSSTPAVPDAPLEENDYNTDVAHLQKILANLGYLNEHCVTSGYYCASTAAAVRDFRYCYHLYSGDVYRYDSRTKDMLYRVVCYC